MSGPAIHHLIAERLRSKINHGEGLGSGIDYSVLQNLLSKPENLPYLFLGSQGPDFLFFNTKDMNPTIGSLVEAYYSVYDFIDNIGDQIKKVIPQPVLDALEGAEETVDGFIESSSLLSELKQTFEDISKVLDGILGLLLEAVKKFITDFNVFGLFSHPYRDGVKSDETWWWFDALHYRKSGDYLKALLENSPEDSPLRLYALGYLTHYSADTVGHPFVNLNSGGPYRSHAQRHKTSENYHDVFIYNLMRSGKDFNHSALHWLYNFNYRGEEIKPIDQFKFDHDHPDLGTTLPDELAEFIAQTINQVYQEDADADNEYGNNITAEDINNAYRMYYKWFKSATDTGTLPPPVAYSLSEELKEVYEKAKENLGNAGDFLEDAMNEAGKWGLLGLLLALAALIIAAGMAAMAIADAVAGAIATMSTAAIRAAACLIYEHVYNAYQNFRLGVAVNGLAFPMLEHLDEPRFKQFQNTSFDDALGHSALDLQHLFPMKPIVPSSLFDKIFHKERHMVYPLTEAESQHPVICHASYLNSSAQHYAFGEVPFQPSEVLDTLDDFIHNSRPDEEEMKKFFDDRSVGLGNALDLIENTFARWKETNKVLNFNLDGDRGYGYACWTQTKDGVPNNTQFPEKLETYPVNLQFIP